MSSFIFACRNLYFKEIRPLSKEKISDPDYNLIYNIAMDYFKKGRIDEFMGFLQEDKYFIQLWVSHLVLEYANPSVDQRSLCLKEINKYSVNPLAPEVAKQEMVWLKKKG